MMKRWAGCGVFCVSLAAAFAAGYLFAPGKTELSTESEPDAPPTLSALDPAAAKADRQEILGSAPEDFAALWQRFFDSKQGDALSLLAARWIDVDLAGACAHFSDSDKAPPTAFMEQLALADAAAALAFAKGLPEEKRTAARSVVLRTLASIDPALVAGELNDEAELWGYREILRTLVRKQPSLAPQLLAKLDGPRHVSRFIPEWAAVDPEAALAWAKSVESPETHNAAIRAVIERIAVTDPAAAGAALGDLDFGVKHQQVAFLNALAGKIADANSPEIVVDWVLEHCPPEAHRDILFRLTSGHAEVGLKILSTIPEGKVRDSLLQTSWMNWRDTDMSPAFAWVDANIPEGERANVYGTLGSAMGSRDFEGTLRALDGIPAGAERDSFESQLFIGYAQRGSGRQGDYASGAAALEMILERYDADRAEEIVGRSFPSVSSINPAAAEVFLDHLSMEYRNAHPSYLMASVWSKKDVRGAMDWAAALPVGKGREDALYGLAYQLSPNEETATWFNTLPMSEGRDKIGVNLIRDTLEDEPANAFAWAQSLSDGRRGEQLAEVVAHWANQDSVAATAAVRAAPISEAEKRALTLRLENQSQIDR